MEIAPLLLPDADRPVQLAEELCRFFAALPTVADVLLFGSVAREAADRWSDMDLLVVTTAVPNPPALLHALNRYLPVLHHAPARPSQDHPGGHMIGTVFQQESVFHALDLNFVSLNDCYSWDAYRWFGPLRDASGAADVGTATPADGSVQHRPSKDLITWPVRDPDELQINEAMFQLRRAIKKVLRKQSDLAHLVAKYNRLTEATANLPENCVYPDGNICQLAYIFRELAAYLLTPP